MSWLISTSQASRIRRNFAKRSVTRRCNVCRASAISFDKVMPRTAGSRVPASWAAGRKSWRHGSIVWRAAYLRTLIGTPIGRCDIDRTIRRIRFAGAAALAASVLITLWLDGML